MIMESVRKKTKCLDTDSDKWFEELFVSAKQQGQTKSVQESAAHGSVFLEKCEQAADFAYALASISTAIAKESLPRSMADVMEFAARKVGMSLHKILAVFGIDDIREITAANAKSFARLAAKIGIGYREAVTCIRISFAEQLGHQFAQTAFVQRRGRMNFTEKQFKCEQLLKKLESNYDNNDKIHLSKIIHEIDFYYESNE